MNDLEEQIQKITDKKQADEDTKAKIQEICNIENMALELKRKQEEEKEAELEKKRQEKVA
jgi:hypothetical protein